MFRGSGAETVLISAPHCYGASALTPYQIPEAGMRPFAAATSGLVLAVLLVLAVTALGAPGGKTSPRPLLTTAPPAPGK